MSDAAPHPVRRLLTIAAKLALSVGLMAFVLRDTSLTSLWDTLRQVQPAWIAAAMSMHVLVLAISVWRWRLLLGAQHVLVPGRTLAESFWVGLFFNNFLPSNIGGDVVRLLVSLPPQGEIAFRIVGRQAVTLEGRYSLAGLNTTRERMAVSCKWPIKPDTRRK